MDRQSSLLAFSEQHGPTHKLLAYAFLLSVTFALYGAALYFDFVWDDTAYILVNYSVQSLQWTHWNAIWTQTYLGHYAPVHHTFLALLYHFFGTGPFGYHLAQMLLHAASVCLLYLTLARLEVPRVAFLASLLFAVHPTNIETVAWIAESKSTLAFLFFLLSFLFFIRLREHERWGDGVLAGLFLTLSILAKVSTVVAPALFLLYDYKQGLSFKRSRVWSLAPFFVISLLLAGVHIAAFHGQALDRAYYGGPLVHLQNIPLFIFFYIRMALLAHPLSAAHMFRVYGEFNWIVGAGMIGFLILLWLLYRGDRHVRFWALWFLIFLVPVLQFVPNPIWVADRYLYIPVIGACVLVAKFFFWIADRLPAVWPRFGWEAAAIAVLVVFGWRIQNHLPVWRNDLTLWQATTPTCMESAYCHSGLGQAHLAMGNPQRGGDELVRAVQLEPTPLYLMYLADALTFSARNYPEAIRFYREALARAEAVEGPRDTVRIAELYAKLARAHVLQGSLDEAARAIQAGKKVDSGHPQLWVVASFLGWRGGNMDEARRSMETALHITGKTSGLKDFVNYYWADASDTGRLLRDLASAYPDAATNPVDPSQAR